MYRENVSSGSASPSATERIAVIRPRGAVRLLARDPVGGAVRQAEATGDAGREILVGGRVGGEVPGGFGTGRAADEAHAVRHLAAERVLVPVEHAEPMVTGLGRRVRSFPRDEASNCSSSSRRSGPC
jgi:hypothetical protein